MFSLTPGLGGRGQGVPASVSLLILFWMEQREGVPDGNPAVLFLVCAVLSGGVGKSRRIPVLMSHE